MAASEKQVSVIRELFYSIPEMQSGFQNYKDKLYDETLESEKRHRRGRPSHMPAPRGFSADIAAQYFTVKHLRDEVRDCNRYSGAQLLGMRREIVTAYGMADKWSSELFDWHKAQDWTAFDQLDYCRLND